MEVTSKIKDVTVFFRGAQITRTVALQAGKGKHILIIDQLPNTINDQSIQVNGKENCKILSVKHEIVYPISKKSQTEKDINEKIESIEYEMKAINNRFNVFGLEEKLLMDNRKLNKSKDGSTMANIKEAAEYSAFFGGVEGRGGPPTLYTNLRNTRDDRTRVGGRFPRKQPLRFGKHEPQATWEHFHRKQRKGANRVFVHKFVSHK